ncbi:unnamed protein product [Soboliphyme baturini]|uniref:Secreted RxLR effector peptide protein n=1 Tax=Soboliphyme baturini TaxID=241478 RepID=A0A183IUR0_9BILA|nr:unnamed protein product [Soboliphyme baturini]
MKLTSVILAVFTAVAVAAGAATTPKGVALEKDLTEDLISDLDLDRLYRGVLQGHGAHLPDSGMAKRRFYQWAGKRQDLSQKSIADNLPNRVETEEGPHPYHLLYYLLPDTLQQFEGNSGGPKSTEQQTLERLRRKFYQWAG